MNIATGRHQFRQFFKGVAGSVTAEFVIVFPIILATLLFVLFVSFYVAATSELQNLAHEMVRYSYRYMDENADVEEICDRLSIDVIKESISKSMFLQSENISIYECGGYDFGSGIYIGLSYNFYADVVSDFARSLGIDAGRSVRKSFSGG